MGASSLDVSRMRNEGLAPMGRSYMIRRQALAPMGRSYMIRRQALAPMGRSYDAVARAR